MHKEKYTVKLNSVALVRMRTIPYTVAENNLFRIPQTVDSGKNSKNVVT